MDCNANAMEERKSQAKAKGDVGDAMPDLADKESSNFHQMREGSIIPRGKMR
jgi:hypothetical protein